jgi:hypothetical protein
VDEFDFFLLHLKHKFFLVTKKGVFFPILKQASRARQYWLSRRFYELPKIKNIGNNLLPMAH